MSVGTSRPLRSSGYPDASGNGRSDLFDELNRIAADAPPLTLAQQLDLDILLYGDAFVQFSRGGAPKRIDPRDVILKLS